MTVDPPHVLCVGEAMVDVVARLSGPLAHGSDAPAPISLVPGGSAANTASWLEHLGASATLVARVGADVLGTLMIESLPGVSSGGVVVDRELPTGTCIVLVSPDGERTMVPSIGANAALSPNDLDSESFASGRHLHLSAYTLFGAARTAGLAALELARAARMSISVDAASSAPIDFVGAEVFLSWLGTGVLLFANADEARQLTGLLDPADAVRVLGARVGAAVVKLGPDGALWSDGEHVVHEPTEPVEPLDTTGAGDAFAAGMLSALGGGATPREALRSGHQAARLACLQLGGRP